MVDTDGSDGRRVAERLRRNDDADGDSHFVLAPLNSSSSSLSCCAIRGDIAVDADATPAPGVLPDRARVVADEDASIAAAVSHAADLADNGDNGSPPCAAMKSFEY